MKKHFKDEDLIRFLYDEMSQEEADTLLSVLCTDEKLWQRYEDLQNTIEEVKVSELNPSQEVCNQIMAYVKETDDTEEFEAEPPHIEPVTQTSSTKIPQSSLSLMVAAGIGLFMLATVFGSFYQIGRTKVQQPGAGQFVQENPMESTFDYEWDDADIGSDIESIEQRIQKITGEKVM